MNKKIYKAIVILTVAIIASMLFIGTESAFSKKIKPKKTSKSSKIVSYPKTGKARLDSLLMELPQKGERLDTNYVNLLANLGMEYHMIDQVKGIEFAKRALAIAEKLGFKKGIPLIYNVWASNLNMSNRLTEAIEMYEKALSLNIELKDTATNVRVYANMGLAYSKLGDTTKSLKCYFNSMDLAKKIDQKENIARTFMDIGRLYLDYKNPHKAMEYFVQSYKFAEEYGLKNQLARSAESIAYIYLNSSDYPKALEYYEIARKIYQETGDKGSISRVISNIGWLNGETGDKYKSLEYSLEGLRIDEEIGDKLAISERLSNIVWKYGELGDNSKNLEYCFKHLKIDEEIDNKFSIASDLADIGGVYMRLSDYPKMFEYLNRSLKMCEELNYKKELSRIYNLFGIYYTNINENDKALESYNKSQQISIEENDKQGAAFSLHNIASLYLKKDDYSKAIEIYFKVLKMAEELGEKKIEAETYSNIGLLYNKMEDYKKGLEYNNKALQIAVAIKDIHTQAQITTNIGSAYLEAGNNEKAIEYLDKSKVLIEASGDVYGLALYYINTGLFYSNQSKYNQAIESYSKALKICIEKGFKDNLCTVYHNIGIVYKVKALDSSIIKTESKDSLLNLAVEYILKANEIARQGNENLKAINSYEQLVIVYSMQKNWQKALENYKLGQKLQDSIFSFENQKKFNQLEAKKDLEVKQKENELLAERTKLQESELGRQKEQLALLNSRQQIQSLELDKKSLEISTKNNELSLLEKDKEINNIAFKQKEAEQEKSKKEIQLLNKDKQYEGVVRKSLFGGVALLTGLATILFLFFWRKKKDNKKLAEKNIQITEQKEIIEVEQEKSEHLLLNVLPPSIATRLKAGETTIADHYDEASVVFIDIVDFTKLSSGQIPPYQGITDSEIPPYQGGIKGGVNSAFTPEQIVALLNQIYTQFDKIAHKYGLEKIKTIGDCYMAAAGVPEIRKDNAEMAAKFAIEAMNTIRNYDTGEGTLINFRCGIDCGPVVAGVIGEKKFIYDLWGDTVNTAARMEEYGEPGRIQVTERFKDKLTIDNLQLTINENQIRTSNNEHLTTIFEERGEIDIKGKGKMNTWFISENHK